MTGTLYERDSTKKGHDRYTFPDILSFQKEPYATVIPSRSPEFKVHRSEGLANSALSHHHNGAKYKQENGAWVKVWEFTDPTNCSNCDVVLTNRDRHKTYWGDNGDRLTSPLHKGSQLFAPVLCLDCYQHESEVVENKQKAKAWAAEQKRRAEYDAKHKN